MDNVIVSTLIDGSNKFDTNINNIHFQAFLEDWDLRYKEAVSKIILFNPTLTSALPKEKKTYLVKAFYHIRGHFHDFLWYMGNHAPDKATKSIILNNIAEEFGGSKKSHEQLYYDFAHALGVNIKKEIIEQTTYEPFIVNFNKGHLKWLHEHDWLSCLAAFSAYEHLDNIDYTALSTLASSLGAAGDGVLFFKVHEMVKHFEPLFDSVVETWKNAADKVKEGFNFIGTHQLTMWNDLSNRVFCD